MHLYLKFLFCLEISVVLLIINPYIRLPINHYILISDDCNIIYSLILIIIFNSLLSYVIYRLFDLLRNTFYGDILEIIEYIAENYYMELSYIECVYGYIFITRLSGFRKADRSFRYASRAKRYISKAEEYKKLSQKFNSVSALLDRSGNGGLYDSFTEWNRSNRILGEVYQERAIFFWRQAHYLGRSLNIDIVVHSPESFSNSPVLTGLTGL